MDSPDLRAGPVHQKCASASLLNLQRAYGIDWCSRSNPGMGQTLHITNEDRGLS